MPLLVGPMSDDTSKTELVKAPGSATLPETAKGTAIQSFEQFLEVAPNVTESLGRFMISVGELERNIGRSLEALGEDFVSRGGVVELVKVAPPEVVAKFLQVMVRAARVGSPELKGMTADQKIDTGKQMMLLAAELRDLFETLKKAQRSS